MKIAFLVDKCSPRFTGGYENRYFSLARRLARRHEIRVYTSIDVPEQIIDGVRFIRGTLPAARTSNGFRRSALHSAGYAIQLIRNQFDTWTPDVTIVEAIPFAHLATMRRWLPGATRILVVNVNEAWSEYPAGRGLLSIPTRIAVRSLLDRGLSSSDLVVTISNASARSLAKNYSVRSPFVVPMGVDSDRFDSGPEWSPRAVDFVTVGRSVAIKRQEDFVRALGVLRAERRWSGNAALIGDGPRLSGLERLSSDLSLGQQLRFLRGLNDDEKFAILRTAKVFVLCSEREGFSLATLEAQASGAAVVVSRPASDDVYGVSDLVSDGESGLVYATGDVRRLASILDQLLADQDLRIRLAQAGWRAARTFEWDRIADALETVLLRALVAIGPEGELTAGP